MEKGLRCFIDVCAALVALALLIALEVFWRLVPCQNEIHLTPDEHEIGVDGSGPWVGS